MRRVYTRFTVSRMPDLVTLLLQIAAVVLATRFAGRIIGWIGQPRVVGEMLAGILLGPSLLGWAAPAVSQALFPPSSLGYLNLLSQLGLLLFMFLVGLEFNTAAIRRLGRVALAVSAASIVVPFLLGAALADFIYPRLYAGLSDASVPKLAFVLFMAAAMSVTAFPVLARILSDRKLARTELGVLAIACASVDDVFAWFILAYITAFANVSRQSALEAAPAQPTGSVGVLFVEVTAFGLIMVLGIRPALKRLYPFLLRDGEVTESSMGATFLLLLLSAAATEWLGIHLLFGAFLFGAILPREPRVVAGIVEKLEAVTKVLLLPIYFAYTGLRTSLGSLRGGEMWLYCGLITLVAIAGKLGGASVTARAAGVPWRKAAALGALMNTRGLMQLIILNVGLELGVINQTVFSMMILMALITTFLTTPLVMLLYPTPEAICYPKRQAAHTAPAAKRPMASL